MCTGIPRRKNSSTRAAHGVAHVGLGVVDDVGAGLLDDVHLGGRDVDAVAEHGARAQEVVLQQALDRRDAAAVLAGVPDVVHALADVDVEAGEAIVGLGHLVHRLVGEREGGVPAEHRGDHGVALGLGLGGPLRELGVLGDGLVALLVAAAVGGLVAQARADARLLADVLDRKEGARDLAEARVVVEDRGHAVAQAVEHGGVRTRAGAIEREVVVDLPPLLLEVLQEVVRVAALDGEAARQAGVDVGVAVHQARHDDAAVGVNVVGIGVGGAQGALVAHRRDLVAVDQNGTMLEVGACRVARDDASVSHENHVSPIAVAYPCEKTSGHVPDMRRHAPGAVSIPIMRLDDVGILTKCLLAKKSVRR